MASRASPFLLRGAPAKPSRTYVAPSHLLILGLRGTGLGGSATERPHRSPPERSSKPVRHEAENVKRVRTANRRSERVSSDVAYAGCANTARNVKATPRFSTPCLLCIDPDRRVT